MKQMRLTLILLVGLAVLIVACTSTIEENDAQVIIEDTPNEVATEEPQKTVTPDHEAQTEVISVESEIKELQDGTKYIIHPSDIQGGGVRKDGIPSIDNPKFITVENADKWIDDDEFGAAIIHNGVKRFYPFQILVWHEIVNDDIGENRCSSLTVRSAVL